jgi:hypothetical protein
VTAVEDEINATVAENSVLQSLLYSRDHEQLEPQLSLGPERASSVKLERCEILVKETADENAGKLPPPFSSSAHLILLLLGHVAHLAKSSHAPPLVLAALAQRMDVMAAEIAYLQSLHQMCCGTKHSETIPRFTPENSMLGQQLRDLDRLEDFEGVHVAL